MDPEKTSIDLINDMKLPQGQRKKFANVLWEWLAVNSRKTAEQLISCQEGEIEAWAAEFVDAREGLEIWPRSRDGKRALYENRTSTVCQVRDIMIALIQERSSKTPKKKTKKGKQPVSRRKKTSKTENRLETVEDPFYISDGEFHTAETVLPVQPSPKTSSLAEPGSRKTEQNDAKLKSREISEPVSPISLSPSSAAGLETAESDKEDSSPREQPRPAMLVDRSSRSPTLQFSPPRTFLNTKTSIPAVPAPLTPTLASVKKRGVEEAELEPHPTPILSISTSNVEPSVAEQPDQHSPLVDNRRVRRRLTPASEVEDPVPGHRRDMSHLIQVRGKPYELGNLGKIADEVLRYIRRCESKSLQSELAARTSGQRDMSHGRAGWFKDLYQDLESRIESLATDTGDGVRPVSSYCERSIDRDHGAMLRGAVNEAGHF